MNPLWRARLDALATVIIAGLVGLILATAFPPAAPPGFPTVVRCAVPGDTTLESELRSEKEAYRREAALLRTQRDSLARFVVVLQGLRRRVEALHQATGEAPRCGTDALDAEESDCERGWGLAMDRVREIFP